MPSWISGYSPLFPTGNGRRLSDSAMLSLAGIVFSMQVYDRVIAQSYLPCTLLLRRAGLLLGAVRFRVKRGAHYGRAR